ncbi:MFS transporter [Streptomyces sp. NPDC001508]|uniref:MFS transporter n=1 Tax=Streptomyces sp. NPDC001508 TaxID=3154656 RepID=UPI003327AA2A
MRNGAEVTAETDRSMLRRVVAGGGIGNFVEWFDYGVYGYLATTLATVFFPSDNRALSLLATFGAFGVSFLLRPLGGLFFGKLGDRAGRQRTLVTVIVIMSASTFVIGLLPTHEQIGLLAPTLLVLVRCVQGFSAGGEYAGASSFVIEHAPANKRATYASALPMSTTLAFIAAAGLTALLSASLSASDFESWGWRVPFLIAGPLGLIGLFVRRNVEDTPAFRKVQAEGKVAAAPLRESLRTQGKPILLLLGFLMTNSVGYYMLATYLPSYFQEQVELSKGTALLTNMAALLLLVVFIAVFAVLADRVGRKPIMLGSCLAFAALTIPAFLLAQQGTVGALLGAQAIIAVAQAGTSAVTSLLLVEMFPTRVRYTSASVSYNLAYMLFGGTAPFVATWLVSQSGSGLAPAVYITVIAVISVIAVLQIRETKNVSLLADTDEQEPARSAALVVEQIDQPDAPAHPGGRSAVRQINDNQARWEH